MDELEPRSVRMLWSGAGGDGDEHEMRIEGLKSHIWIFFVSWSEGKRRSRAYQKPRAVVLGVDEDEAVARVRLAQLEQGGGEVERERVPQERGAGRGRGGVGRVLEQAQEGWLRPVERDDVRTDDRGAGRAVCREEAVVCFCAGGLDGCVSVRLRRVGNARRGRGVCRRL